MQQSCADVCRDTRLIGGVTRRKRTSARAGEATTAVERLVTAATDFFMPA